MYEYQKRAYKRRRGNTTAYLKPFLVILVIMLVLFGLWRLVRGIFISDSLSTTENGVVVSIETGTVRVTTSGSEDWTPLPDGLDVFSDERLQTGINGRVTLESDFDGSLIRLDHETELEIEELREGKGSESQSRFIHLALSQGAAWFEPSDRTDESTFVVSTDYLEVNASGGTFAMEAPGRLYVISGTVDADLILDGEVIRSLQVSVGQQLDVNPSVLEDVKDGVTTNVILAISDAFEDSDWFLWNQVKNGVMIETSTGEDSNEEGAEGEEGDDETDSDEEIDEGDEDSSEDEPENEGEDEEDDVETETQISGDVSIESPSTTGTHTTDDPVFSITGSVPEGTSRVDANNYTLQGFSKGNTSFRYNLNPEFGNISEGSNEYTIRAYDENDNLIDTDSITITYEGEEDEPEEEEGEGEEETVTDDEQDDTEQAVVDVSGSVVIQSPSSSSTYATSDSVFSITGSVPQGTSTVVVNNYTLESFSGTSFAYNVNPEFGNIAVGSNTYTVKAYDPQENLISSDTITITLEEGQSDGSEENTEEAPSDPELEESSTEEVAEESSSEETEASEETVEVELDMTPPTITAPSSSGTYQTDLSELVISGAIGKGLQEVFVNGVYVAGFVPGEGNWFKNVTLQPGDNVFTITPGGASITITYQP